MIGISIPLTFATISLFFGYRSISLRGQKWKSYAFVYPHIESHIFNIVYNKHSHVSDLHIDMFLFSQILLQQNYEF